MHTLYVNLLNVESLKMSLNFCSPHWPYCFGILGEVWGDSYSRQLLEVSLLMAYYCSIVCCSILEPLGELQLHIAALSQHPTPQGRFRKILEFSTNRRSNWSTNVNLKYKWSFDFDGHIENDGQTYGHHLKNQ